MLLSLAIINAIYHTFALAAADIHFRNSKADENNGSIDTLPHKGGPDHPGFLDQQQTLNTLSCVHASFEESAFSNTCQHPFHYGAMGSIEQTSHFKKIQSFKVDYTEAQVTQYESQRTGMRVSVVDRKGPKVCLLPLRA